jgi:hypothetical protein
MKSASQMLFRAGIAALALALAWQPAVASACSVCYGEPDSPAARGLSAAIVVLGSVVMCVVAGAVAFFVQANRKATLLEATEAARSVIEK